MSIFADVDTALSEVPVNSVPLTDDTDFKTTEESIAYNASGMDLEWHFFTTAGAYTVTAVTPTTGGDYDWAHQGNGMYTIEIPASGGASINNDTEGHGYFVGTITGVLPFRGPTIIFRASGLNDLLIDSAYSATRGLAGTALPAAAADAAGGLVISDAGGFDIDNRCPSATSIGNMNIVFNTDFATNYNTTNDQWVVSSSAVASVTGAVGSVTGAVGSVTGNVGGNVTGSVGSISGVTFPTNFGDLAITVTTGLVSVGTVGTGAITAAAIADGAIDAATFAADVDAEILSYIVDDATRIDASALNTAATAVGGDGSGLTEAGGTGDQFTAITGDLTNVLADTNEIQTDLADGGRLDLLIDAIKAVTDALGTAAAAKLFQSTKGIIVGTVDSTAFSPTTTEFEADDITTAAADHYNDRTIMFLDGTLDGQATGIQDYELATGRGHFTVTAPLTSAPADDVTFVII